MQGKMGIKDDAGYSASRWEILGLMKSAALERGQDNITVNAILAGQIDTPLTFNEHGAASSGLAATRRRLPYRSASCVRRGGAGDGCRVCSHTQGRSESELTSGESDV
jgi:NAD(P)-dependent dehydrogenase (short-subunit alcohol dehydrogenase family)